MTLRSDNSLDLMNIEWTFAGPIASKRRTRETTNTRSNLFLHLLLAPCGWPSKAQNLGDFSAIQIPRGADQTIESSNADDRLASPSNWISPATIDRVLYQLPIPENRSEDAPLRRVSSQMLEPIAKALSGRLEIFSQGESLNNPVGVSHVMASFAM